MGWGPAAHGVQCRAFLPRTVLEAGEPPVVQIDARSLGGEVGLFVTRGNCGVRMEVDGNLLPDRESFGYIGRGTPDLPPGGLIARPLEVGRPLPPGKHTVRGVFANTAYSLPVDIWVLPPRGADANAITVRAGTADSRPAVERPVAAGGRWQRPLADRPPVRTGFR